MLSYENRNSVLEDSKTRSITYFIMVFSMYDLQEQCLEQELIDIKFVLKELLRAFSFYDNFIPPCVLRYSFYSKVDSSILTTEPIPHKSLDSLIVQQFQVQLNKSL